MDHFYYLVLACFLRTLGFLTLLPLGEAESGTRRRIVVAVPLAAFMFPWDTAAATPANIDIVGLAGDFLIGIVLGIPLLLTVEAAAEAVELFETARGQNMAAILDPMLETQGSPLAILARHWTLAELAASGGLAIAFTTVAESCERIPLGSLSVAKWEPLAVELLQIIIRTIWALSTAVMPFLALLLSVDVMLGSIEKLGTLQNLQNEHFVAKTLIGVAAFLLAVSAYGGPALLPLIQIPQISLTQP